MLIHKQIEQRSEEWFKLRAGKITGTRFGKLISSRKNNLVYELANESLDGVVEPSDFANDDMQYGIDNEDLAIDMFEDETGLSVIRGGVIESNFSSIHMASPDGIIADGLLDSPVFLGDAVVLEVKCTRNGTKHLSRYIEGIDTEYMPQIKNYRACSDSVKVVIFISYCGLRSERPMFFHAMCVKGYEHLVPEGFVTISYFDDDEIGKGRNKLKPIEKEIKDIINTFLPKEPEF